MAEVLRDAWDHTQCPVTATVTAAVTRVGKEEAVDGHLGRSTPAALPAAAAAAATAAGEGTMEEENMALESPPPTGEVSDTQESPSAPQCSNHAKHSPTRELMSSRALRGKESAGMG